MKRIELASEAVDVPNVVVHANRNCVDSKVVREAEAGSDIGRRIAEIEAAILALTLQVGWTLNCPDNADVTLTS
jgi:hypothetical protein